LLSAIYRWLTSKIRLKGRLALAVEANLRTGQSTAPAELATEPVYIPVPGRAGMFVRTYPTVPANSRYSEGALKRLAGRPDQNVWLDNSFVWSGLPTSSEIQIEPRTVPQSEVVVGLEAKP